MLKTRYDLPLDRDDASRFMPWIVAMMVFLSVLATIAFLTISSLTERWTTSLTGTVTVQIAADTGDETSPPLADRVDTAVRALRRLSGVTATPLDFEETEKLLSPWLGEGAVTSELPIPALIDVTIDPDAHVTLESLRQQIQSIAGATIDDHQSWLKDILSAANALKVLALAVILLLLTTAILVVILTARAGLAIHAAVIDLLHVMGATDRYVAQQFQRHAMQLTFKGAAIGFIAASITFLGLQLFSAEDESLFLPSLSLKLSEWGLVLIIPLGAAFLAALTARIVAARALTQLP